jgi:hypothetical protein
MKSSGIAVVLAIVIPCAAFAQGGGGGGGGGGAGGSAGGSAGGAASSAGTGGSAASSPSGAGAAGTTNSGATATPSAAAPNANVNPTTGTTDSRTGIAIGTPTPPSGLTQGAVNGDRRDVGTSPGTNAAGTAGSSGTPAVNTQGSAPAGGIGRPTTTDQRDTDAKIDQENTKVHQKVKNICKNC